MAHFSGESRMTRRAMPVGTEGKRETLLARVEVLGRRSVANRACRLRSGSWRHLRVAWGSRRDTVGLRGRGQCGFALLEVLIASIVVGITILGVSLMLVRASAFTVSEGTNQAVLYLAEQKLEKLRAWGFDNATVLGSDDTGANDGCDGATDSGEPCYKETDEGALQRALHGGAVTNGQPQSFTRLTCVDYVSDSGPPYPAVCTPNVGSPTSTKRVQVKVQPLNQAALAKADDITLDMILIKAPLNAAP